MARFLCTIVLAASVFLANPAISASIDEGVDAYGAGDYATAFKILEPLAEQGFGMAQFLTGMMYMSGDGTPKDPGKAAGLFRRAAHQDIIFAQFQLGILYRYGHGVNQSVTRAYFWFSLAARRDFEDSVEILEQLAREMTPEQIAEANAMVQAFEPRFQKWGVVGEGLEIQDVQVQREEVGEADALIISARITNVSDAAVEVPRIKIVFLGCDGEELRYDVFDLQESEIEPGDAIPFDERLVSPPLGSRKMEVTFLDESKHVKEGDPDPVQAPPLQMLGERLRATACKFQADEVIDVAFGDDGVFLSMPSYAIFKNRSAEISKHSFPVLSAFGETMSSPPYRRFSIVIAEHWGQHAGDLSDSELAHSKTRVDNLMKLFVEHGVPEERIETLGDARNSPELVDYGSNGERDESDRYRARKMLVRVLP